MMLNLNSALNTAEKLQNSSDNQMIIAILILVISFLIAAVFYFFNKLQQINNEKEKSSLQAIGSLQEEIHKLNLQLDPLLPTVKQLQDLVRINSQRYIDLSRETSEIKGILKIYGQDLKSLKEK